MRRINWNWVWKEAEEMFFGVGIFTCILFMLTGSFIFFTISFICAVETILLMTVNHYMWLKRIGDKMKIQEYLTAGNIGGVCFLIFILVMVYIGLVIPYGVP